MAYRRRAIICHREQNALHASHTGGRTENGNGRRRHRRWMFARIFGGIVAPLLRSRYRRCR